MLVFPECIFVNYLVYRIPSRVRPTVPSGLHTVECMTISFKISMTIDVTMRGSLWERLSRVASLPKHEAEQWKLTSCQAPLTLWHRHLLLRHRRRAHRSIPGAHPCTP